MERFKILLLIVCILGSIHAVPLLEEQIISRKSDDGYRLSRNVIPSEYDLTLTPYLEHVDPVKAFSFDGEVKIKLKVLEENISEFVLHSKNLVLEHPKIMPDDPEIEPLTFNSTYDFVELKLNESLSTQKEYTISFKFKGKLRTDMFGFYRSWYKQGNETKWLATTQFEQGEARTVFPCFDEPAFKAIFKLKMVCPPDLHCLSNMDIKSIEDTTYTYHESPKMSTYLLAFLVSEFERDTSNQNELFQVWSRPDAKYQGSYAIVNGVKLVDEMFSYTGISYYDMHHDSSIKMKIDNVAVPDFKVGAMENWGLITYKEDSLMIHELFSTTKSKQRVLTVVAHEIAHKWFGNLVTCDWWSVTWLNEGFATLMTNYISNNVVPGFHMDEQFVTDELYVSMAIDDSLDSHPLTNPEVNTLLESRNMFSPISYKKGASVIRMLEHWIGPDTFQKGVRYYLSNMTYQSAVPEDLFRNMQNAADEDNSIDVYEFDVKDVFKSWTEKSGHPVLRVSVNHIDKTIVIKQERYLRKVDNTNKDLYMIPITYATAEDPSFSDTKPKFIMHNEIVKLGTGVHDDWVIFNVQQTGFYRILYDDEMYGFIIAALQNDDTRKSIHKNNRAQIINDAFTFAKDDKIKMSKMFDVMQFLENELDYTPWMTAFSAFGQLRKYLWTFEKLSESFDMHISKLMEKLISNLDFEIGDKDEEQRRILRTEALKFACDLGHEKCIEKSIDWFKKWLSDKTEIPPDHREFVYCTSIRHGDPSYFDELWKKYLNENVINEKNLILASLGCTAQADQIMTYLSNVLEVGSMKIRDQDRTNVFNWALRGNKDNVDHVFDFFVHHVENYRSVYGEEDMRGIITSMTSYMSKSTLVEFKEFLNNHNNTLIDEEVAVGLKAVKDKEENLGWVETNQDEIMAWINAKYNTAGTLVASVALLMTMLFGLFMHHQ